MDNGIGADEGNALQDVWYRDEEFLLEFWLSTDNSNFTERREEVLGDVGYAMRQGEVELRVIWLSRSQ